LLIYIKQCEALFLCTACIKEEAGQPKAASGWFALLTLPHKPDSYSNDSNYIYRIEALETTLPLINHLKKPCGKRSWKNSQWKYKGNKRQDGAGLIVYQETNRNSTGKQSTANPTTEAKIPLDGHNYSNAADISPFQTKG
jgi:hypothetical protein